MSKVNIVKLVEDVIGEVKPRADELGLKVVNQPDSSSPVPEVLADLDKIKEVLINFIGNSFKFSPKGSSIEITYKIDSGFVVVSVTDHGEGISPEDIDKLFQKFSLIKESYVTNQKAAQGTGLGLYISKNIIEMHGGKVWAESKGHGTGATFNFSLKVFSDTDLQKFQQENSGKQGLGIIPNVI